MVKKDVLLRRAKKIKAKCCNLIVFFLCGPPIVGSHLYDHHLWSIFLLSTMYVLQIMAVNQWITCKVFFLVHMGTEPILQVVCSCFFSLSPPAKRHNRDVIIYIHHSLWPALCIWEYATSLFRLWAIDEAPRGIRSAVRRGGILLNEKYHTL